MAMTALQRGDERSVALVETVSELAKMDEARIYLAGIVSGLDIHYDLGDGHPLLGRRMPDLDIQTAAGPPECSNCSTTRGPSCSISSAGRPRHRALGGPGPVGRRSLRRQLGTPGRSARSQARRRRWFARTVTSPGWRRHRRRPHRCADDLVRIGRGIVTDIDDRLSLSSRLLKHRQKVIKQCI